MLSKKMFADRLAKNEGLLQMFSDVIEEQEGLHVMIVYTRTSFMY